MNKLALIGGKEIKKYTVADVLWKIISKYTKVDFFFEIISISNEKSLEKFYRGFKANNNFIGFNIALPWKNKMAKILGSIDTINTVYKYNNNVFGINTDVIGVCKSLNYLIGPKNFSKVLILGAGGAGLATANYFSKYTKSQIYIYDILPISKVPGSIIQLKSLDELERNQYDLIINATPLGKYYNSKIEMFSSPIDLNILRKITTDNTVLQDMNYLPEKTLFLQLGDLLNLKTVSGVFMLVFQALDSFKKYFGFEVKKEQADKIILEMIKCVHKKERQIISLKLK